MPQLPNQQFTNMPFVQAQAQAPSMGSIAYDLLVNQSPFNQMPTGTPQFTNPTAMQPNNQLQQLFATFAPMLAPMLTDGQIQADQFVRSNQMLSSQVSLANRRDEMIQNLQVGSMAAQNRNIGAVLAPVVSMFGGGREEAEQVAGFLNQFGPALDPRMGQVINALDISGGRIGLAENVAGAIMSEGRGLMSTNKQTAKMLQQQLIDMVTDDVTFGEGDSAVTLAVQNADVTAGMTNPEFASVLQQMVASGQAQGLTRGTDDFRTVLESAGRADDVAFQDIFEQLDRGEISDQQAFSIARDRGFSDTEQAAATQDILRENLEEAQPLVTEAAESIQLMGGIFEEISGNIPELMRRLGDFTNVIDGIDRNDVQQSIAKFESLVDLVGTTSEELYNHTKILQSRLGVSFERGAELAAQMRVGAAELQRSGTGADRAERVAAFATEVTANQERGFAADRLLGVLEYADEETQERMREARATLDDASASSEERQAALAELMNPNLTRENFDSDEDYQTYIDFTNDVAQGSISDELRSTLRSRAEESGGDITEGLASDAILTEIQADIEARGGAEFDAAREDLSKRLRMDLTDEQTTQLLAFQQLSRSGNPEVLQRAGLSLDDFAGSLNQQLGLTGTDRMDSGDLLSVLQDSREAQIASRAIGEDDATRALGAGVARVSEQAFEQLEGDRKRLQAALENSQDAKNFAATSAIGAIRNFVEISSDEDFDITSTEGRTALFETIGAAMGFVIPGEEFNAAGIELSNEQTTRLQRAQSELQEANETGDEDAIAAAEMGFNFAVADVAKELGANAERTKQLFTAASAQEDESMEDVARRAAQTDDEKAIQPTSGGDPEKTGTTGTNVTITGAELTLRVAEPTLITDKMKAVVTAENVEASASPGVNSGLKGTK